MNLTRYILCASAALAIGASADAAIVVSEKPGNIRSLVPDTTTISITISGNINAADLYSLGDSYPQLRSLDISGATILPYEGPNIHLSDNYPAATIPTMAFAGAKLESLVLPIDAKTTIGDGAFAACPLTEINLTQVDSIGMGAFASCQNLREITIPTSRLGSHIFDDCLALAKADVSAISVLPAATFARCSNLREVVGSEGLTSIGDAAFQACSLLKALSFGTGLKHLGNSAFELSGLTAADMSKCAALTALGNRAFASCSALADVKFSANTTDLGQGSFFEDAALTAIDLPKGLTHLPERVFKGNANLGGTLVLPEGLTAIHRFALKDAAAVDSLVLPAELSEIGDFAMENMTGLRAIDASKLTSVPTPGIDVWRGVNQPSVSVKAEDAYIELFRTADQWEKFSFLTVSGVDGITDDSEEAPLRGRFEGYDLLVSIDGVDIASLDLYDLAGRRLVSIEPSAQSVVINTAQFGGRVFIVNAKLADGRQAALKLARNI